MITLRTSFSTNERLAINIFLTLDVVKGYFSHGSKRHYPNFFKRNMNKEGGRDYNGYYRHAVTIMAIIVTVHFDPPSYNITIKQEICNGS